MVEIKFNDVYSVNDSKSYNEIVDSNGYVDEFSVLTMAGSKVTGYEYLEDGGKRYVKVDKGDLISMLEDGVIVKND